MKKIFGILAGRGVARAAVDDDGAGAKRNGNGARPQCRLVPGERGNEC
jgi:hypothetical protein